MHISPHCGTIKENIEFFLPQFKSSPPYRRGLPFILRTIDVRFGFLKCFL